MAYSSLYPYRSATWLAVQCVGLLAVLFVAGKAAERVLFGRHWHSFGRGDLLTLCLAALAVSVFTWYVHSRLLSKLAALEHQRQEAIALAEENTAVLHTCRAIVEEWTQPLSGVAGYSELLTTTTAYASLDQRHQLEGLREGVLQLEGLLVTLRDAINTVPESRLERHLADQVARAVKAPRSRLQVQVLAPRAMIPRSTKSKAQPVS